jgi:hypothetical protein
MHLSTYVLNPADKDLYLTLLMYLCDSQDGATAWPSCLLGPQTCTDTSMPSTWAQENGHDCGVFMCVIIRELAGVPAYHVDRLPTVTQAHIPHWRTAIALECYVGALTVDE